MAWAINPIARVLPYIFQPGCVIPQCLFLCIIGEPPPPPPPGHTQRNHASPTAGGTRQSLATSHCQAPTLPLRTLSAAMGAPTKASKAASAGPPPVPSCCAAVGITMLIAANSSSDPLVWLATELNCWVLYLQQ